MNSLTQLFICAAVITVIIDRASSSRYEPLELGFEKRVRDISDNEVALTFDDGPDPNTINCLDVLRDYKVKATFFINTKNYCNLDKDPKMQAVVRRIVKEGHDLGSHSVSHPDFATLSADGMRKEMLGVRDSVRKALKDKHREVTLFRAPFGSPYHKNNPKNPSQAYRKVAPVVKENAVQVGWNVDSYDYKCEKDDSDCVVQNVKKGLKGANGVILFNSVWPQTCEALPKVLDYLKARKYSIISVESIVHAKYGKHSYDLIHGDGSDNNEGEDDGDEYSDDSKGSNDSSDSGDYEGGNEDEDYK